MHRKIILKTNNRMPTLKFKKRMFFPTQIYEFELLDPQNQIDYLPKLIAEERNTDQLALTGLTTQALEADTAE